MCNRSCLERSCIMIEENKTQEMVDAANDRREFLKTAGKFGITAPMAALLLSVNSKKSAATGTYGGGVNGS